MTKWCFSDSPNVAVIVNRRIVKGQAWIAYVSHDEDDGGWQFHTDEPGPFAESDASVVSLENIVQLDPSIIELADLPLGWNASRPFKNGKWHREKTE